MSISFCVIAIIFSAKYTYFDSKTDMSLTFRHVFVLFFIVNIGLIFISIKIQRIIMIVYCNK